MNAAHESIFSYNITKPYPFKWFTPVVAVGFVVFTVLFSFLNFASNGYDLIVQTSSDPNATVSQGIWFRNWPSYLTSKVQPRCQATDIHVNSQIFTNQTALTYTLTDVWQGSTANPKVLPSLTYFNNVIGRCGVSSVEVDLEFLDRSGTQIAYSEWGTTVRAYVTCAVDTDTATTHFNMTTTYDYVPDTSPLFRLHDFLGTDFLDRNNQTRASLYWGESIMSMYWGYLSETMRVIRLNATQNDEASISKGTISFLPTDQSDITDLHFFGIDYRLIVDLGQGDYNLIYPGIYNETYNITRLDSIRAYPNIWIITDTLVKATYSTVLTDLGQTSEPNILTDSKLLEYFTSNFSTASQHLTLAIPGPATQDFHTLGASTGPLGTTPSVISTTYICQVPQLKSGGSLFLAILIADLVFLQTLWKVFTLVTEGVLLRKRPSANQCLGCGRSIGGDQISLGNLSDVPLADADGQPTEESVVKGLKRRVGHKMIPSQQQPLLPAR